MSDVRLARELKDEVNSIDPGRVPLEAIRDAHRSRGRWVKAGGVALSTAAVVAGFAVIGGLDRSRPTTPTTAAPGSVNQLVTRDYSNAIRLEALLHGTLGVNSAGCFTFAGGVLVAPLGAVADPDGQGITWPDGRHIAVGDGIVGGGGVLPVEPGQNPDLDACVSPGKLNAAYVHELQ